MIHQKTSHHARAEAGSGCRRKRPIRTGIWMLVLALSLTIHTRAAFGQMACYDQCQQALAQCLQLAADDPVEEARCQDRFDSCLEHCLDQ
jgi:hypothetical protein